MFFAEVGEVAVWKLSAVSLLLSDDMVVSAGWAAFSGVAGGDAPGMDSMGCEESGLGPPPEVGGRDRRRFVAVAAGDRGGDSGGAGMLVPAVRE